MSTPEFQFPLSFTGPDGIGATPFDDYAEAERPDVSDDGQDPAVALRRTLGMFATGVTVITTLKGDEVRERAIHERRVLHHLEPRLSLIRSSCKPVGEGRLSRTQHTYSVVHALVKQCAHLRSSIDGNQDERGLE